MEGQEAVFLMGGIRLGGIALPVLANSTADAAAEVVDWLAEQGSAPVQARRLSPWALDVARQF
jgi:hypothetical protein